METKTEAIVVTIIFVIILVIVVVYKILSAKERKSLATLFDGTVKPRDTKSFLGSTLVLY